MSAIFKIENTDTPSVLHVEIVAASTIAFDLDFNNLDYMDVIVDLCKVAPHIMNMDADLMEFFDGTGDPPKKGDRYAIAMFLSKYKGCVSDELKEAFRI